MKRIALSAVLLFTLSSNVQGARYAAMQIGVLSHPDISVVDLNSAGSAVGNTSDGDAYRWTSASGGSYLAAISPGASSRAGGINDLGEVVGASVLDNLHAVLWDDLSPRDLHVELGLGTDADYSIACDISNSGQVILRAGEAGFIWDQADGLRGLGSLGGGRTYPHRINDTGQITGTSYCRPYSPSDESRRAFLWTDGVMINCGTLGGTMSEGFGVNDLGHVVGEAYDANGDAHAFLWRNGAMQNLGTLGGDRSEATAINNLDQVVGYAQTVTGRWEAFIWEAGGMKNLNDLVSNVLGIDYLGCAWGINDHGQIIAAGGGAAYLLTPVPEPSGILILLCGLLAVATTTARRLSLADPDAGLRR
jgi:probable HAF family extracellular repeat protein